MASLVMKINQVRTDARNNLSTNGNLTGAAFIHHMIRDDKRATKITQLCRLDNK